MRNGPIAAISTILATVNLCFVCLYHTRSTTIFLIGPFSFDVIGLMPVEATEAVLFYNDRLAFPILKHSQVDDNIDEDAKLTKSLFSIMRALRRPARAGLNLEGFRLKTGPEQSLGSS